jgi:hypothetical protein
VTSVVSKLPAARRFNIIPTWCPRSDPPDVSERRTTIHHLRAPRRHLRGRLIMHNLSVLCVDRVRIRMSSPLVVKKFKSDQQPNFLPRLDSRKVARARPAVGDKSHRPQLKFRRFALRATAEYLFAFGEAAFRGPWTGNIS